MTFSMVACVLALISGFYFKGACLQPHDDRQLFERLCYTDLIPLYGGRGVEDNVFPYVNGELDEANSLVDGAIEYPVLTGLFMYVTGLPVTDGNQFYVVSAILLASCALAAAYLLARMSGPRALMWAAAPAIVLYSFHNWDLLVVVAAVAGLWCWSRDKPLAAAVWFGIGAGFKMYPIFFLAPLFFDELRRRGFARALGAAASGVATLALVNLPFFLANREGWLATYEFHRRRGPNFDSIWSMWFPSDTWLGDYGALTPDKLNLVTAALTGAFFVAALGYGWWRSAREDAYPFVQVCAALLAAFLLWNKVHSPQYTLWILPFFVVTGVSVFWWVAYAIADMAAYYGIFQWFYDLSQERDFAAAKKVLIGGVWGRAVLLLILFALFLRARPAVVRESENVSHPPDTVPDGTDELQEADAKGGASIQATTAVT